MTYTPIQTQFLKSLKIEDLDDPREVEVLIKIMDEHDHKDEKCNCLPGIDE